MNRLISVVVIVSCCAAVVARAEEPELVDIKTVDPTIIVDLRYATERNVTHRRLYPSNMQALVRPSVADRLVFAQKFLREHGLGLKIWDAFRPKNAQQILWETTKKEEYFSDPNGGIGSMHTRGVAVDATLIDTWGRELQMPTDFDTFTPAAMLMYQGTNEVVRGNLTMLQRAMARAGFYGLRTEWWHFCAEDWRNYPPLADVQLVNPQRGSL